MSNSQVTINLVVMNGEKYIRHCLSGIMAQTYGRNFIEFNILDNGSVDRTIEIIQESELNSKGFLKFNLIESKSNLGMWPGQEELLKHSSGKYILAMAVDVILDNDFIKNAVGVIEKDEKIGGLEAKIYKYDLFGGEIKNTNILDTCGFKIFRSRRLINIGHGEEDRGQYDGLGEIFGVEGACPFFRRDALEDCRVEGEIFDRDYFWYGDDFDIAWRMNLFGWKQVFEPSVIARHDRQTTKKLHKGFSDFRAIRRTIPLRKRQLEWKNIRFTILKNDYIINILKDLPCILKREVSMFVYLLIFEPRVLAEISSFFRLTPRMLKKRSVIMKRAVRSPKDINKFFR